MSSCRLINAGAAESVLKIFTNFTGKQLWLEFLFSKVAGLRPATLLKRDSNTAVSYEICEIFKNT